MQEMFYRRRALINYETEYGRNMKTVSVFGIFRLSRKLPMTMQTSKHFNSKSSTDKKLSVDTLI